MCECGVITLKFGVQSRNQGWCSKNNEGGNTGPQTGGHRRPPAEDEHHSFLVISTYFCFCSLRLGNQPTSKLTWLSMKSTVGKGLPMPKEIGSSYYWDLVHVKHKKRPGSVLFASITSCIHQDDLLYVAARSEEVFVEYSSSITPNLISKFVHGLFSSWKFETPDHKNIFISCKKLADHSRARGPFPTFITIMHSGKSRDQAKKSPSPRRTRLPITPEIMLLKICSDAANMNHVMLWVAFCTCFFFSVFSRQGS